MAPPDNPLKFDPELRGLLDKLKLVKTYKKFKRWKNSFLDRFETFLEDDGIESATQGYKEFTKKMEAYVKKLVKVEDHIAKGELSANKKSVKAALSFREMCKELDKAVVNTEKLIPANAREEKQLKFNKYQLGAVLIRDGFEEYERMKYIQEVLTAMAEKLGDVADKQDRELFDAYKTQVSRFCDVMADLGLYEVMLKCREFAEEPEEEEESSEEPEPDPDPIMFVDMKTCSVFETEREDVLAAGILTEVKTMEYREQARDNVARDQLIRDMKDHPNLGLATQIVIQKIEVEDVQLEEAAAVSNMWGVNLKKRAKKKKGEEFVFIDPKTNAAGVIDRKKCIEKGFITPETNDAGKEVLKEGVKNNMEYDRLIQAVRRCFNISAAK